MTTVTPETIDLHAHEPDPLEPSPEAVERYVKALQELAESDPELAARRAWGQIQLAGVRAGRRREEARDTLNRMFRLGGPPDPPIDGPTDGILVTPVMPRVLESPLRALTSAWMPWLGKRFDAAAGHGDNLLTASARVPARALWPTYRPERLEDGRLAAFRFRTYVGPGTLDPDRQNLKIDYDSDENPALLIRDILDELVQLVPGAYLGKVLLRRGEGAPYGLIGYFALRVPHSR
jgi:hypothetical protein